MKIVTDRLIIRSFKFSDDKDLFEMCCDPLTAYNAGWSPYENIKVARNVIVNYVYSDETYAIILKENNKLIGTISLYKNHFRKTINCRELGFCLNKVYRNLGYMTEAVGAVLEYGFNELYVDLIMTCHHERNFASRAVISKYPFQYEGTLRMYRRLCDDTIVDGVMYSMKKEEFWRYKNERNEA